jgi:hypothetical protein
MNVWNFLLLRNTQSFPFVWQDRLMILDDLLRIATVIDKLYDGFGRTTLVVLRELEQSLVNTEV